MKTFHFDGPTWAFLTPEQMYDEEGKLRRAHRHYENADIYFLSIMNKCVFIPEKTKVSMSGDIRCEINFGNANEKKFERIKISYPLAEVIYSMPGIKDKFESRDDFLFHVLFYQYKPNGLLKGKILSITKKLLKNNLITNQVCFKILSAIYASEIQVRHETRFEINIFDPLTECMTDTKKAEEHKKRNPRFHALNSENWNKEKTKNIDYTKLPGAGDKENIRLTIEQIVNHFDIDVGYQRVAYIGKTEKEPFERLFPHKKLNELDAKLLKNEYETLVIHLFGFMSWDSPVFNLPPKTSVSISDSITVTEAELINYFKPEMNEKFVIDTGKSQWKHIKLLRSKNYQSIKGLIDIDGQFAKFYTDHVGETKLNTHEICVSLDSL